MTMKFLYAKPIDENRCAIVVDMGNGKVVGGVVILTAFNSHYKSSSDIGEALRYKTEYTGLKTSHIDLVWQWSKGVDAADLAAGKATIFDSELLDRFANTDQAPEPPKVIDAPFKRVTKRKK